MPRVDIRGTIVPNDDKWVYDWLEYEATCPADVRKAIDDAKGQLLDVYISSPGGEIAAGSDIYSMLSEYANVQIHITGQAHSAASVIAMAGKSEMAPTALMMVHCVSTYAAGNHNDMEHTAEVLQKADEAMAAAYEAKSGMSHDDVIQMMENETWLTAKDAVDLGLVDSIMETPAQDNALQMAAGSGLISRKTIDSLRDKLNQLKPFEDNTDINSNREASQRAVDIVTSQFNLLKLSERRK